MLEGSLQGCKNVKLSGKMTGCRWLIQGRVRKNMPSSVILPHIRKCKFTGSIKLYSPSQQDSGSYWHPQFLFYSCVIFTGHLHYPNSMLISPIIIMMINIGNRLALSCPSHLYEMEAGRSIVGPWQWLSWAIMKSRCSFKVVPRLGRPDPLCGCRNGGLIYSNFTSSNPEKAEHPKRSFSKNKSV